MPFPREHYVLTMGGPFFAVETWSMSLRTDASFLGDATAESEQASLTALAATVQGLWTGDCPISNAAKLTYLKYNRVDVNGHYVRQTTNEHVFTSPVATIKNAVWPAQVALVATLETGVSRGLANRGRIFLPSPAVALEQSTGTFSTGACAGVATWVASLLSAINAQEGIGNVIVGSKVREGQMRQVTGVTVGTAPDTMRSRRTKILEARAEAAVVTPEPTGGPF